MRVKKSCKQEYKGNDPTERLEGGLRMKTRKFTAMLLTLAMAFSLLTVSAGAVMDNDHDRISVDKIGRASCRERVSSPV